MTFKNIDEVLAHYGWGGEAQKEDKSDETNGSDDIPAAGEDCESAGDAE